MQTGRKSFVQEAIAVFYSVGLRIAVVSVVVVAAALLVLSVAVTSYVWVYHSLPQGEEREKRRNLISNVAGWEQHNNFLWELLL